MRAADTLLLVPARELFRSTFVSEYGFDLSFSFTRGCNKPVAIRCSFEKKRSVRESMRYNRDDNFDGSTGKNFSGRTAVFFAAKLYMDVSSRGKMLRAYFYV